MARRNRARIYGIRSALIIARPPPNFTPPAIPYIYIKTVDSVINEGASGDIPFKFKVVRHGASLTDPSTVDYAVVGFGPHPAIETDFKDGAFPSGVITIEAGAPEKLVTIYINGDSTVEFDTAFSVTISNPTNGVITNDSITGIIVNDDLTPSPVVSIQGAQNSVNEGLSGITNFTFTVGRIGTLTDSSIVGYTVSGYGATPAIQTDFENDVFPVGSVEFLPDENEKTITIGIKGNAAISTDKHFLVQLINPIACTINIDTAIGTVLNDDVVPDFSIEALSAEKAEGTP